jgi:myo-inositol-1(or 4)-monophosphatase
MNFTSHGLEQITRQVVLLSKQAGAFIREERLLFQYEKAEIKGVNDLVSYVDREAEKMLVKGLQEIIPEAGFLVEENTLSIRKDLNWIVDPLDGTTNFVHGVPCYAVSIGLESAGEIILGVVYEVSRDECFYAWSEGGAYLNGKPIRTSNRKSLDESLIATGFPIYNFSRLDAYLSTLKYFMQHTQGVRRIGSAASDLCYVACGRMDAFFEYNLNPWDVAAGACIVKEAGGKVSDFTNRGNWLFGKEICAANSLLFEEFQKAVQTQFSRVV